jgi:hypothetical protein
MDHERIRVIGFKLASGLIRYLLPEYLVATVVRASAVLTANIIDYLDPCYSRVTRDKEIRALSVDDAAKWEIWIECCSFF